MIDIIQATYASQHITMFSKKVWNVGNLGCFSLGIFILEGKHAVLISQNQGFQKMSYFKNENKRKWCRGTSSKKWYLVK